LFNNSGRKKYGKKLHLGNLLLSSPLFKQAAPKFVYKWNPPINTTNLNLKCDVTAPGLEKVDTYSTTKLCFAWTTWPLFNQWEKLGGSPLQHLRPRDTAFVLFPKQYIFLTILNFETFFLVAKLFVWIH